MGLDATLLAHLRLLDVLIASIFLTWTSKVGVILTIIERADVISIERPKTNIIFR